MSSNENPEYLRLPRGMLDLGPEATSRQMDFERDWFKHTWLWGYRPVRVPPVGFASTFTTGHNAAGERTYMFDDRKGRKLALVSDSLPAVLRHVQTLGQPEERVSFCCPVFRYIRRPLRYLHHLGAMRFVKRPDWDLMSEATAVWQLLDIVCSFLAPRVPATVFFNDIKIWRELLSPLVQGTQTVTEVLRELDQVPMVARPAWLADRGADAALVWFSELLASSKIFNPGNAEGDHLLSTLPDPLQRRLEQLRMTAVEVSRRFPTLNIKLALTNFHASEFHDGIAFEICHEQEGIRLGDGGVYGAFSQTFLGKPAGLFSTVLVPERIVPLLQGNRLPAADIMIHSDNTPPVREFAQNLCTQLRANGISVWDIDERTKLKKQLRDAAFLDIKLSILIGTREVESHQLCVRRADGSLVDIHVDEIVPWIKAQQSKGIR